MPVDEVPDNADEEVTEVAEVPASGTDETLLSVEEVESVVLSVDGS